MTETYDFEPELALASGEYDLEAQLHTILGEAEDAASFTEKHWLPIEEGNKKGLMPRPGMSQSGPTLRRKMIGETRELIERIRDADTRATIAVNTKKDAETVARGVKVSTLLRLALQLAFDDDVEDEKDDQLAALKKRHYNTPATADALALLLEQFGTLARKYQADLAKIEAFDVATIDEAFELGKALRAIPNTAMGKLNPERATALHTRNKLLHLLRRRVKKMRGAARFVFIDYPDLLRAVASENDRRERQAQKRAAASEGEDEAESDDTTTPA